MSSGNLRDHCALALTVLFSGAEVEPARLPRSVDAGRMRSSEQSPLERMGRLWEAPGCHHHHVPTLVMPIREESLRAALCFCGAEGASSILLASFPAGLASLVQFGGWKRASRSSHLLAWPCCVWGRLVAGDNCSSGVPQTSLLEDTQELGEMHLQAEFAWGNPNSARFGGVSPLSHTPKSAGRGQPCSELLLQRALKSCHVEPFIIPPWQPWQQHYTAPIMGWPCLGFPASKLGAVTAEQRAL